MAVQTPLLDIPEPAHPSVPFSTYKACAQLLGSGEVFDLPIAPLTAVHAPSSAARDGVPISFVESEAYCRTNNLVHICGDTFALFGQAGLFIIASGAEGRRLLSQVSDQPVLSAVAQANICGAATAVIAYTTADGCMALLLIDAKTGNSLRSASGSIPGGNSTRIWLSSMRAFEGAADTGTGDVTVANVLAYRLLGSRRPTVEVMALRLRFQDAHLVSETLSSWHGQALPRASSWTESAVLVVSTGSFTPPTTGAPEDAMDTRENGFQPCYDMDTDSAIVTVLPLTGTNVDCAMEGDNASVPSTRSWALPRGDLLAARDAGHGGLALLLSSGMDALACKLVLSPGDAGTPAADGQTQCLPGLASVSRARQNLRFCLWSHASTFCGLFEAAGANAATVFRNPAGEAVAPTFSAPLGYEEEVLGAHLTEDSLHVLTPLRISRFALDASVRCNGGTPALQPGAKLPGGIDAAALLRMLDAAED